eukprot:COSAG01_NODE_20001_length_976_cov_73.669327_2_plen_48_part_01
MSWTTRLVTMLALASIGVHEIGAPTMRQQKLDIFFPAQAARATRLQQL